MAFTFYEEVVNSGELNCDNFRHPRFIGYLNPNGEPIDYSKPFGLGGHDNNPTTDLFKQLFYIKYNKYEAKNEFFVCLESENEERERRLCKRQLKYIDDKLSNINSDINFDLKLGYKPNKFILMKRDLLQFFKNCYSNDTFTQGFGKDIRFMNRAEFYDKAFIYIAREFSKLYESKTNNHYNQYSIPKYYDFEFQYQRYIDTELLNLLKEVFICYLGYHSVERIPRTITTSTFNIYETFYNYFENNFNIVQLPKMIFDSNKKMYIEHSINEFLIPDKELRLRDEIQSTKRLIHSKEKSKYYR